MGYLNVNNPSQVGSVQKLSVLTGEPNVWLFVYSGLAQIQQYDQAGFFSGGESSNPTVNIVLDNISGELLEFATTASLANINGSGGVNQYGIESNQLALRDNGDLVFTTSLYVFASGGDFAELGTYSYYVSAKILLEATSISGTIRWVKSIATPLASPHFVITANTQLPAPPGAFVGGTILQATGAEGAVNATDQTYYYVPYTITGPLLGKTVFVSVNPNYASFKGVQPIGSLLTKQISGPLSITLTPINPAVTNVNFEMGFVQGPR